jgi:hypothetical protein
VGLTPNFDAGHETQSNDAQPFQDCLEVDDTEDDPDGIPSFEDLLQSWRPAASSRYKWVARSGPKPEVNVLASSTNGRC